MFCPKCGVKNPEAGKFCRSCGNVLGGTTNTMVKNSAGMSHLDRKGRPISWEGAITKFAAGVAFLTIAIVLAVTGLAGGNAWWFWMLIPAFMMMGSGIAHYVLLRKLEQGYATQAVGRAEIPGSRMNAELGAAKEQLPVPEPRYRTGDLVPPSVTDETTKLLELEKDTRRLDPHK